MTDGLLLSIVMPGVTSFASVAMPSGWTYGPMRGSLAFLQEVRFGLFSSWDRQQTLYFLITGSTVLYNLGGNVSYNGLGAVDTGHVGSGRESPLACISGIK